MRYATDPHAHRNQFETTDLTAAGFLRCRQFPLVGIEARNNKALFVFADSPALRRALVDYANDAGVPVHTLCETIRHLKSVSRQVLCSRERLDRGAQQPAMHSGPRTVHPRPTAGWRSARPTPPTEKPRASP